MPLTWFELNAASRRQKGWHVYDRVAKYQWELKTEAEKLQIIRIGGHVVGRYMTSRDFSLRNVLGRCWREFPSDYKQACSDRAQWLNARPRRYIINELPVAFNGHKYMGTLVTQCVTQDLIPLRGLLTSAIRNGPD